MPANRPYVIGLTGGIGCGKTEAAKHLESLGAARLDADAISRALTAAPGSEASPFSGAALPAIREAFGESVFQADGTLDRASLARTVFSDPAARRRLEGILHPMVQRTMLEGMDEAAQAGARVVILDVPLLFETGMDALCDETWTLYASRETQIARLAARDRMERADAEARIDSQMSTDERVARATHAINTEQPIERTRAELTQLYQQALKRS